MIKNTLDKYLVDYAEAEITRLKALGLDKSKQYRYCLTIPCFNEEADFFIRLSQHPDAKNLLCISVINSPIGASESYKNQALMQTLVSESPRISDNLYFASFNGLDVLVVDRFSLGNQIAPKKGVGLARKIACDIACWLWQQDYLQNSIIFSTDADAHLPDNYFSGLLTYEHGCEHSINAYSDAANEKDAAYVFDFSHFDNHDAVSQATQAYEQSIKYYRDGLLWASSPYAFYTLGSCLALNIETYCKVRGFPPRAGGEDFYLLNKMAKLARVTFIPEVKIQIEARISQRVPFGTGPAVAALLASAKPLESYNPQVFLHLKKLLHWSTVRLSTEEFLQGFNKERLRHDALLDERTVKALEVLNISEALKHFKKQCRNQAQLQAHFHTWFDGFKTLKFIHVLQKHFYPPKALNACLDEFVKLQRRSGEIFCP